MVQSLVKVIHVSYVRSGVVKVLKQRAVSQLQIYNQEIESYTYFVLSLVGLLHPAWMRGSQSAAQDDPWKRECSIDRQSGIVRRAKDRPERGKYGFHL